MSNFPIRKEDAIVFGEIVDDKFQEYDKKIFVFLPSTIERQKFTAQIQNAHYLTRLANLNDVFLNLTGYQIEVGT